MISTDVVGWAFVAAVIGVDVVVWASVATVTGVDVVVGASADKGPMPFCLQIPEAHPPSNLRIRSNGVQGPETFAHFRHGAPSGYQPYALYYNAGTRVPHGCARRAPRHRRHRHCRPRRPHCRSNRYHARHPHCHSPCV